MVTINNTVLQPIIARVQQLWQSFKPKARDALNMTRTALSLASAAGKNPALQGAVLRHLGFVCLGYLLTLSAVYLYSLRLTPPESLPAQLTLQLQQQDVDLAALNEAVARLEKKKALAKL